MQFFIGDARLNTQNGLNVSSRPISPIIDSAVQSHYFTSLTPFVCSDALIVEVTEQLLATERNSL